jgi:hypothetical protein
MAAMRAVHERSPGDDEAATLYAVALLATVAMLGAIESLMSAVVADRMSGDRHNSNVELIAQGVANIVSPMFGGLPATGAIVLRVNVEPPVLATVRSLKVGERGPLMLCAPLPLKLKRLVPALKVVLELVPLADMVKLPARFTVAVFPLK